MKFGDLHGINELLQEIQARPFDEEIDSVPEADEEKDVEFYRTLDAKQLNACKLKLNSTIESLDHAIEFRARNSHLYFNTGDKAGTGDLYRMKEQLEKLLNSWDEAIEIYGM